MVCSQPNFFSKDLVSYVRVNFYRNLVAWFMSKTNEQALIPQESDPELRGLKHTKSIFLTLYCNQQNIKYFVT